MLFFQGADGREELPVGLELVADHHLGQLLLSQPDRAVHVQGQVFLDRHQAQLLVGGQAVVDGLVLGPRDDEIFTGHRADGFVQGLVMQVLGLDEDAVEVKHDQLDFRRRKLGRVTRSRSSRSSSSSNISIFSITPVTSEPALHVLVAQHADVVSADPENVLVEQVDRVGKHDGDRAGTLQGLVRVHPHVPLGGQGALVDVVREAVDAVLLRQHAQGRAVLAVDPQAALQQELVRHHVLGLVVSQPPR